ncbi:bifunctional DNA primase/polymerase famiily protein [Terriglobus roseus DSM 18391]|uniref:Bifunctional DNA primase/polymerase famiily protein n=1 Tax=Terriglobus roseus (strain DSM 18391 / NRRL B-41598 / KBS 63) TaxID=926566 RepID=I3ZDZ5_TERRK|nr:AAA family ATPase [Terriglobus roseus]AFL87463.1 bifunctional DNA primase/polymerase famiily protein [Terriglobus roseus DSM 18391]
MTNKDAAIALASERLTVFGCGPDKKPKGPWKDVTVRPAWQVGMGWHDDDLPAIPVGKHNMVVIDCDVAKPNRPDGRVAFAALCTRESIDLSSAFVVTTPSGGLHFYFKTDVPYGNSPGALPAGIDVRGRGGYVVGPGAVMPDGRTYRHDHGSWEAIPLLPEALAKYLRAKDDASLSIGASAETTDALAPVSATASDPESAGEVLPIATDRDKTYAERALEAEVAKLSALGPGGRRNAGLNDACFVMGTLAANGSIEAQHVAERLYAASVENGHVAKHGHEQTAATIESGIRAGMKKPRPLLPDGPDIPLQALLDSATTAKQAIAPKPIGKRAVSLLQGSQIVEEPISWLWEGYLPKGKLTLLAGAGGTGKSTLAFNMAATITNGTQWPDGTLCPQTGNVLIWSSEDDPADTIKPRLMAVNADQTRYGIIAGTIDENGERDAFDPARDMESLREAVTQIGGIKLLIIDPIVTAVTGDMHKANDVRRSLQAIVDFASEMDCAVLGITHFAKGTAGKNSAERVIGSQAFAALARMVLVAAREEDSERRVFTRAKSNNSVDTGGFSYTIEALMLHSNIVATRVVWGEALEGSSRSILADVEDEKKDEDEKSQLSRAQQFLLDSMRHGPVPSKELMEHARELHGISAKTCRRAKDALGITAHKASMTGGWLWQLPVARS